jgi:hypothetical protein
LPRFAAMARGPAFFTVGCPDTPHDAILNQIGLLTNIEKSLSPFKCRCGFPVERRRQTLRSLPPRSPWQLLVAASRLAHTTSGICLRVSYVFSTCKY